ncbi:MAG: sulfatase [Gemmatimonadaceae bacterium]
MARRGDDTPEHGRWGMLWIVVVGACLGALGETMLRLATRLMGRPTYLNPQAVWLAPLFALAVLAIPTLLCLTVVPRARRVAALVLLASTFALMEVLWLLPRLAPWALALVALGIGVELARRAHANAARTLRWARTAGVVLVGGSAAMAVGVNARRLLREHYGAKRPAAPPTSLNVVLVVLDAVRAEGMGLFGGPVPNTPFMTQLASQCVVFDRAVAPASWTLPSHASMFTGRWPADLDADWAVPLDAREPVLAEQLNNRGYRTGAAVGNYLYTYYEFGLQRGFAHYDDYGISMSESAMRNVIGDRLSRGWNAVASDYVVPGRKDATRIRRDALRWVDAVDAHPFFLFVNLYDAHDPYAPPKPWRQAFLPSEPPTRALGDLEQHLDSASVNGLRSAYHGAIAYLDAEVDSLVGGLRSRDLLDRTVVIITADHGEEFAEHRRLQHGNTLYYPSVHVPLMVCPPRLPPDAARRIADVVSLRDLPATILQLAGGSSDVSPLPGRSLDAYWRLGTPACRSKAISFVRRTPGAANWYRGAGESLTSLVEGDLHLIRTDQGSEELFNVASDAFEQRDLTRAAGMDSVLARLRESLAHPDACAR